MSNLPKRYSLVEWKRLIASDQNVSKEDAHQNYIQNKFNPDTFEYHYKFIEKLRSKALKRKSKEKSIGETSSSSSDGNSSAPSDSSDNIEGK